MYVFDGRCQQLATVVANVDDQITNRADLHAGDPLAGPDAHAFQQHPQGLGGVGQFNPHIAEGAFHLTGDGHSAVVALPALGTFAVFTMLGELVVFAAYGDHRESRFHCGCRLQSNYLPGLGESLIFVAPMFPCRGASGFFRWLAGQR
jgi:hypothetical protein